MPRHILLPAVLLVAATCPAFVKDIIITMSANFAIFV